VTHDRRPDLVVGVPRAAGAGRMVLAIRGTADGPDARAAPAVSLTGLGRLVAAEPGSGVRLARPAQR
jgi:hypothetical protein